MIEVFARRPNAERAAELVDRLREEGHHARQGNASVFDPAQIDKSVERVYHDGGNDRIPATYEPLGIPCELIDGAPADGGGYHVVQSGPWHKLIGPDGEQVGKSQRSEADAWALREDV